MNEYEAHESSYDHQHKKVIHTIQTHPLEHLHFSKLVSAEQTQRLKEMKQMQRDPNASDKARRAERRADEKSGLISIKPIKIETKPAASGSGFKKGGFKSAFGGSSGETTKPVLGVVEAFKDEQANEPEKKDLEETEDFGYEYYDPRKPTGCGDWCLKAR